MTTKVATFAAVFACVLSIALGARWAFADDPPQPPPVYYVSMRNLATEASPSFVTVEAQASATHTAPVAGCDGLTYYATPSDAAAIAAARTNGEVVQLHFGESGGQAQSSAIMCVIDGAGST